MTDGVWELHGYVGEKFPLLAADRIRDILASYCAMRWPLGRRKAAQKHWDLTADEARSVCEGSASQATLDKIWLHKNGRWPLAITLFGALLGESLEEHLLSERKRHVELARRNGALVRDLRPLADPCDVPGDRDGAEVPRERRSFGG